MVKQESHTRHRSVVLPVRSLTSSTEVQKHVGQTSVQFVQDRQRLATSSHCGCSVFAYSRSRSPSVLSDRPMALARLGANLLRREMVPFAGRQNLVTPRAGPELVEDLPPAVAARYDEEAVPARVEQLGQRKVKTLVRDRAGAHRDAEARAPWVGAGQRDDEVGLAPGHVCRVGHGSLCEDAVVDRDRVQVAGPDAKEREVLPINDRRLDLYLGTDPSSAPQQLAGGEQQRLPRLRPGDVAKHRLVTALTKSVAAGVLQISHAAGQLIDRLDLRVDDRTVPDRRPDDHPPALAEQVDQRLQPRNQQDHS